MLFQTAMAKNYACAAVASDLVFLVALGACLLFLGWTIR